MELHHNQIKPDHYQVTPIWRSFRSCSSQSNLPVAPHFYHLSETGLFDYCGSIPSILLRDLGTPLIHFFLLWCTSPCAPPFFVEFRHDFPDRAIVGLYNSTSRHCASK
jgi:hypothetical protein